MANLNRRDIFWLVGGAAIAGVAPPSFAAGRDDRKFIFVVLRGGLDGLATLVPTDPALETLRPTLHAIAADGPEIASAFRLHPALSGLHAMYQAGEATFIHAAATAYRERSHFDAQDQIETLSAPGARIGWLNRLSSETATAGLGVGYALPLALKGPASTTNWAPAAFRPASADLLDRLMRLYATDIEFQSTLMTARQMSMSDMDLDPSRPRGDAAAAEQSFRAIGKLMSEPDGPGIGMVSIDGWDTHANQVGALNNRLGLLDTDLLALKEEMGTAWNRTCVTICSEFGRTAGENGTRGTDHGTGGLLILAGGAVHGGRIAGDWPGLRDADLRDQRDLAPANAVEDVLAGILRDHLGANWRSVIPSASSPFAGLIRST